MSITVVMRSRFALLLVVAAVVFAPGWSGRAAPSHEAGRELAARVLAPTVDEGALQSAAAAKKQLRAGRALNDPSDLATPVMGVLLASIVFTFLWVVIAARVGFRQAPRLRSTRSRAPPHLLQPA